MDSLTLASKLNSNGYTETDTTVQNFWDADRLDLGRVGIIPSARYLCTESARRAAVIAAPHQRSMMLPKWPPDPSVWLLQPVPPPDKDLRRVGGCHSQATFRIV